MGRLFVVALLAVALATGVAAATVRRSGNDAGGAPVAPAESPAAGNAPAADAQVQAQAPPAVTLPGDAPAAAASSPPPADADKPNAAVAGPGKPSWKAAKDAVGMSKREGASAVPFGSQLLLFGGCFQDEQCYHDLWVFDTAAQLWLRPKHRGESPSERGRHSAVFKRTYKPGEIAAAEEAAAAAVQEAAAERAAREAAVEKDDGKKGKKEGDGSGDAQQSAPKGGEMWVFGGEDEDGHGNGEVFSLDVETFRWRQVVPSGPRPEPRAGHVAVMNGTRMLVFGGRLTQSGEYTNELLALDTEREEWVPVRARGFPPAAREGHSAAVSGDGLFIFGGFSAEGHDFDQLYVFNFSSHLWIQPQVVGFPPSPRHGALMVARQTVLFVFGGCHSESQSCFNDTTAFDTESRVWATVEVAPLQLAAPANNSDNNVTAGDAAVTPELMHELLDDAPANGSNTSTPDAETEAQKQVEEEEEIADIASASPPPATHAAPENEVDSEGENEPDFIELYADEGASKRKGFHLRKLRTKQRRKSRGAETALRKERQRKQKADRAGKGGDSDSDSDAEARRARLFEPLSEDNHGHGWVASVVWPRGGAVGAFAAAGSELYVFGGCEHSRDTSDDRCFFEMLQLNVAPGFKPEDSPLSLPAGVPELAASALSGEADAVRDSVRAPWSVTDRAEPTADDEEDEDDEEEPGNDKDKPETMLEEEAETSPEPHAKSVAKADADEADDEQTREEKRTAKEKALLEKAHKKQAQLEKLEEKEQEDAKSRHQHGDFAVKPPTAEERKAEQEAELTTDEREALETARKLEEEEERRNDIRAHRHSGGAGADATAAGHATTPAPKPPKDSVSAVDSDRDVRIQKRREQRRAAHAYTEDTGQTNVKAPAEPLPTDLRKYSNDLVAKLFVPVAAVIVLVVSCGVYVFCADRKQQREQQRPQHGVGYTQI